MAACLNDLAVGAPLLPGLRIVSPLPALIRLRLACMLAYSPFLGMLISCYCIQDFKIINLKVITVGYFSHTKVYLGTEAFGEREPVLLGATTQDWMKQLLSELERLGKALAAVAPAGSSAAGLTQIKTHGASMAAPLAQIKKAIDDLDSLKVFTE